MAETEDVTATSLTADFDALQFQDDEFAMSPAPSSSAQGFNVVALARHDNADFQEEDNDNDDDEEDDLYAESAQILSRKFNQRDQVKQRMLEQERSRRLVKQRRKRANVSKWQQKTKRSPFMVDLVAETERIEEEARIRLRDEAERSKKMEKKKQRVKNNIMLKALAEASDLELLREEKRMIQIEEKRLKALLDLEKTKASRKADLLAAKQAETRRKKQKAEYRRQQKLSERQAYETKYKVLLKDKLGLSLSEDDDDEADGF